MNVVVNIREIEEVKDPIGIKLFNYDVLNRIEDQRVRRLNLDKAATLGKVSGKKAVIVLATPDGYKKIIAKVLGVDDKSAWIEGRVTIPLMCIYTIDIT